MHLFFGQDVCLHWGCFMVKKLLGLVVQTACLFLLGILVFSATSRLFNYVKGGAVETDAAAHVVDFIAPLSRSEVKPLNTEIDFIDTKRTAKEVLSEVETDWGLLTFSTYGASLERMIAKRHANGVIQKIPVLFPVAQIDRERQCFLVGLAEKTPYFYELMSKNATENQVELVYKAQTEDVEIRKTFIIYNHVNTIDLKLEVAPKKSDTAGIDVRLVYPSPFMPNLVKDTVASVITDRDGSFKKTALDQLGMQRGWVKPGIFGSEDKYFVNALIKDEHNFAQRAYYNVVGSKDIVSYLEAPTITEPHVWNMSFYFGPKEVKSFGAVDVRLEKTLGYTGVLAPVARFLLQVLQTLYGYLGNYGWAIVALIALMQLLMVPFTFRGDQHTKKAKEYQKKLAYIRQKYKNDRDGLAREQAELVQKHGMPGLGGCLPILLFRMPTFFALQQVLNNAIELYQAPFLWISDLSMPDPYYIFPLLVAGGMLLQSLTLDAGQRVQFMVMALIIGGVTTTLSAGLALYITVSTLLGALQTWLTRFFNLS